MSWNVLYALDLFALVLFGISYYRNCYRRGYRVDFWHVNLFSICVLPNLLMLPFATSELNEIVLGDDFGKVMAALPTVFLITLFGYFSILAGGILWRFRVGVGLRKTAMSVLDFVPHCSRMLMSSREVLIFQALLCLFLQLLILGIYFSRNGFGFDLRGFTFANPGLRPVALLASNYTIIIASHCFARYVDKKESSLLVCTLLLSTGLVFFGARSSILSIYLGVALCYLVGRRAKISLLRIVGIVTTLLLAVMYLGSLRNGEYSPVDFFKSVAFLILYGNTFSDLRDFSWVYSAWDHVPWGGKTYLAAFISFIPRVASGFRDTWGLGAATSATVGFDPQVHPGLRPGIFGEGFFNFGLAGVAAVGLMLGIVARRVDLDVKRALEPSRRSMIDAFASTMMLNVIGNFAVTAGFSGLYILFAIYLFSWFCLRLASLVQTRPVLALGSD
jgi:oligosaccharide repeat unit polymerase